jgi:hypothetical protein
MKKTLLTIALIASASFYAQDPVVLNSVFNKIAKISGSDCSCSGWMNKDLGDQAESGTIVEGVQYAIKFDNEEADAMYQEIAVLENTNYKLTYNYRISGDESGTSKLEIRVLAGSGYASDYTPTTYATPAEVPSSGFGYTDIAVVETAANNLMSVEESFPGDDDYHVKDFTFNSGANTSIAIFARGIGNPTTAPVDKKDYTWSAGDQETRIDYVILTNESTVSVNDVFSSNISIYPNPVNEFVRISSSEEVTGVEIYNLIGKKVISSSNLVNNKIDVSNLSKGVYVLKVMSNELVGTRKIIIE